MESRHKILVGMGALIVRVLTLMAYNVISRHNSLQMNGTNITTPCLFETLSSKGALNKSFNYKWITVPDFLSTISLTMLYIGLVEFISAQVPFFMKGVMIGMIYCSFFPIWGFVAGCISTLHPNEHFFAERYYSMVD
jgi:hypothetical protein